MFIVAFPTANPRTAARPHPSGPSRIFFAPTVREPSSPGGPRPRRRESSPVFFPSVFFFFFSPTRSSPASLALSPSRLLALPPPPLSPRRVAGLTIFYRSRGRFLPGNFKRAQRRGKGGGGWRSGRGGGERVGATALLPVSRVSRGARAARGIAR